MQYFGNNCKKTIFRDKFVPSVSQIYRLFIGTKVQQCQQCNSGSSATVHVLQHSSSVTNAQKDVQVFKKLRQTFEKFKVSSSVDKSHRTKIFCLSSLCAKIFETASMTLKTFFGKVFLVSNRFQVALVIQAFI